MGSPMISVVNGMGGDGGMGSGLNIKHYRQSDMIKRISISENLGMRFDAAGLVVVPGRFDGGQVFRRGGR